MSDPPFHEFANIFPLMEGDDYSKLVIDIEKQGLQDPITMHDGLVLDGRNRWLACRDLHVTPMTKTLPPGQDPLAFVLSKNLYRRQLNESQRAMVAKRLANIKHGDTLRQGSRETNLSFGSTSLEDAAKRFDVSRGSVVYAGVVQDKGIPELIKAVEAGHIAVSKAAKIARQPADKQRKAVEDDRLEREAKSQPKPPKRQPFKPKVVPKETLKEAPENKGQTAPYADPKKDEKQEPAVVVPKNVTRQAFEEFARKASTSVHIFNAYMEEFDLAVASRGMSDKEFAAIAFVADRSASTLRRVARNALELAAKLESQPDVAWLNASAQEKLDRAVKFYKEKLDKEFEQRMYLRTMDWLDQVVIPEYSKKITDLNNRLVNRQGIMSMETYRTLMFATHPDHSPPERQERNREAYEWLNEHKLDLLSEKDSKSEKLPEIPKTAAELWAMHKGKVKR